MDLGTLGLAVGATLCWSSTWVLMKVGVDRMDRTAFGLLRTVFGLLVIVPFALITGGFTFGSAQLVWLALAGGFLNAYLGNALFYYALSCGSMHESNILAGINPFWGVVASILVLGEPVRWATFASAVLVVLGTFFLVRRRKDLGSVEHKVGPILAALATGMCYGFSSTVPAKICMSQGMDPITYQFVFTATGWVCWTIVAFPRWVRGRLKFTRKGILIALVSGVTGFFLGWVFWLAALKRVDASTLSPLYGLTMFFAVLLGALLLREPITRRVAIGGILILTGITLVTVFVR